MEWTEIAAIIGIVTGITGAVTGGISLWNTLNLNRVKLHVEGTFFGGLDGLRSYGIVATNLGAFPITIIEVGFISEKYKNGVPIFPETSYNKYSLPKRVESRDSARIQMHIKHFESLFKNEPFVKAYAITACGHKKSGKCIGLDFFNIDISNQ